MGKNIKIVRNGPYLISGKIPLKKEAIVYDNEGYPIKWKLKKTFPTQESYALCRCGKSNSKPLCDGNHVKINFDGTETATGTYLEQAGKITGAEIDLTDARILCSGAGFCNNKHGGIWELTEKSDNLNSKKVAIQQAHYCPSGRLVVWDKKGNSLEPKLKQTISLIEEPKKQVSGPIWVKGCIPIISSNNKEYEKRNRITLCRCGASNNKPFCDSTHVEIKFSDKN